MEVIITADAQSNSFVGGWFFIFFSFFKAEKAEKYVDFCEKNGPIFWNFKNKKLATFLQLVPIGSQNMKGFLNFFNFMFGLSLNLVKSFGGLSLVCLHHKIDMVHDN